MIFQDDIGFARRADRNDPLKKFRKQFLFPRHKGKPVIYFTGNSLGLQPASVSEFVHTELNDWATLGVEGHFNARRPWMPYHKFSKKSLAKIVGALPSEVVAMNQLSVNLHLLMVSFYRPDKKRFKILIEDGAFPSDRYAVESQLKYHGIDPSVGLIELKPKRGEVTFRTEDIVSAIEETGESLALVLLGAVQYYTGQFFNIPSITAAAHKVGATAGFDLAHAAGNVPLNLHRDGVDFAVWCGYKYLNSGPGGIAGIFVHERHSKNFSLPRFTGWWGHDEKQRFKMGKEFLPMPGADGWQLSNFPVLAGAAQLASLKLFDEAGMGRLRKKSIELTGYLEFLLLCTEGYGEKFRLLTPEDPDQRGCQISIEVFRGGKKCFREITSNGVVADWREPSVIRVAPVPFYNSFEDVFRFVGIFKKALAKL